MARWLMLLYALMAYVVFVVAILYAIGFLEGWVVPKDIHDGPLGDQFEAVLVNVSLLLLFAVQHTIMARPAFKRWWTRWIPPPMERSTFVLVASLLLLFIFWQWRPLPQPVWLVEQPVAVALLVGLSLVGWGIVFYASFLIDHFELFGLRQAWRYFRGRADHPRPFTERSLYRWVRHPLMFGFLLAFWATPQMTCGHLWFATVATLYILIGIQIEERDLITSLGNDYRQYRLRTPMLLPWRRSRKNRLGK